MNIQEGKSYYFYDDRAVDDVCKAHVLHVLPHPEREEDRLIVYRWYGKHRKRWWYGVTTISQQQIWADYCKDAVRIAKERAKSARRNEQTMKRETCKKCCWHMEWLLGEVWCTLRSLYTMCYVMKACGRQLCDAAYLETTEWKDNKNHRFELLTK